MQGSPDDLGCFRLPLRWLPLAALLGALTGAFTIAGAAREALADPPPSEPSPPGGPEPPVGHPATPADPGPGGSGAAGNGGGKTSRFERALVPLVGGDTDVGIGIGALGSVARLDPSIKPFRWKVDGAVFLTFKPWGASKYEMPYQDIYVLWTRNGLWRNHLRFELRPAFTRESNLRYYGLGNASGEPPNADIASRDLFTRIHPALLARARLKLDGPFYVLVGTMYTHSWITLAPQSTLLADATNGTAQERSILHLDRNHGLHLLQASLILDTRDDEVSPSRGMFHELGARVSPWKTSGLPYRYIGLSAVLRFYVPLVTDRLVLAARLVGDAQIGDVPFYELSRFDETSVIGGSKYVRGVPSNRYYGKRKVVGNLELRSVLTHVQVAGSRYGLGFAVFADTGRVWADTTSAPALDGTGLGLKYGVGFGLRVQKGKTFVLRGDIAWSPDAHPIGGYFLADHIF